MEIEATAYLRYRDGESISSGWERLEIVIKFKEKGKWFKTKLVRTIATTYHVENKSFSNKGYESYDEYLDVVEVYIADPYLVRKVAENVIIEYFERMSKSKLTNNRVKNIESRVNKMNPIEIKVKIK